MLNALLLPDLGEPPENRSPLVAPSWSLFYELAVNLAYAALLPWLRNRVLGAIITASACLIYFYSWRIGTVGLQQQLAAGFVRMTFSFGLGVWFFRRLNAVPTWLASASAGASYPLVVLALATPTLLGPAWPCDLLVVLLIMPFALVLALQPQARRADTRLETVLGELSYPVYLLHMPIAAYIGVALGWAVGGPTLSATAGLLAVAASLAAVRFYDTPVRNWLNSRTNGRVPREPLRAET